MKVDNSKAAEPTAAEVDIVAALNVAEHQHQAVDAQVATQVHVTASAVQALAANAAAERALQMVDEQLLPQN